MEIFYYISVVILIIIATIIAYQDITTRKIKNSLMGIFLLISILFFIFFHQTLEITQIVIMILVVILSLLFYENAIWGAADGKFFIASTLVVLSLENYLLNFFEFIFNILFIFALGSIAIGFVLVKPNRQYAIIKKTPIDLFLFKSLLILGITYPFIPIIVAVTPNLVIQMVSILAIALTINKIAKTIYYKVDTNARILIGFFGFCLALFQMLNIFLIALISLLLIKSMYFYLNEISFKGMTNKTFGFAPPMVSYMCCALIIEVLLEQTLLLFVLHLF